MAEGSDTGVFDQSTQEGVNRFLAAIGRTPNGMLTLDMQDFLLSSSAPAQGGSVEVSDYEDLAPGDSGDAVLALQRRLVELGYADGTPNGKYGPATISAVTFYQHCNGLEEDGLATAWLQSVLFSSRALTYDQTQMLSEGFGDQGVGETTVPAEEQDFATQEPQPEATPEPEPTPEPETDMLFFNLTLGSTGSAVMSLQNRLVELGYLEMPSTLYDEATRDAVVAFQNAIGVEPTGEASASLQRYIFSKAAPDATVRFEATGDSYAALQLGDTGDAVTNLQRRLWQLGFLDKADVQDSIGTFNDATRQAVIDAQLKMGYGSADGVAGVEFQSFLFSKYGNMLKEKKRG